MKNTAQSCSPEFCCPGARRRAPIVATRPCLRSRPHDVRLPSPAEPRGEDKRLMGPNPCPRAYDTSPQVRTHPDTDTHARTNTHRHSTHHTPRDCWNRAGVHVLRTSPPAKSQACCGSKQGRTSPTPALRLRSPARLLGRRFGPQQRAHRFGSRFPPRKAGAPIAASFLAPCPRAGASMRTCAALRWATRCV